MNEVSLTPPTHGGRSGGDIEIESVLIEAKDLTIRFGSVTAVDGLDLTARTGQVLAILGPNGAGKTTFVKTLATLVRPTSGVLRVRGNDVARRPTAVRRDIGLAGQFAAVEPTMTGRENLKMTARLFGHSSGSATSAASSVISQLSLEDVADRRVAKYSGGQRRRLDLGASLVGAPRILLLDEPTTGLDPTGRKEVWDAVRSLVEAGTDVVLTTHYLEEANELADWIVVIDHGRTIANGTPNELKAAVGVDVIDIVVSDSASLDSARSLVEAVASSSSHTDRNARRISAQTARGAAGLGALISSLDAARIEVEEIGLRRPTLDEVFFSLTGRRTQEHSSTSEVSETEWEARSELARSPR